MKWLCKFFHKWGEWKHPKWNGTDYYRRRHCERCGKTEVKEIV